MMRTLCWTLMLAAGCGPPALTVQNSIGVVKDTLFEDAVRVLEHEGIRVEGGDRIQGVTGIRVPSEDAYRATRVLVEWRRNKGPGAYFTREEFQSSLED